MKYRRLGQTGLKISEIAIGGWLTYGGPVEQERTDSIIGAAIEAGVNFIDLSDIYAHGKAETMVGHAIRPFERHRLVISSKLFWPMSPDVNDKGLSRKHIMESVERSLKRIGTDYLDLYFCHRFDPETPMEETVRAMDDLVHQGKVLYWGTSVWTAAQIEQAVGTARVNRAYAPVVEQPRYNMLDRHVEAEIMPTCARNGMGLVVWSPLAQGLLTGKYRNGAPEGSRGAETRWLRELLTPENISRAQRLEDLAGELNCALSQLALAWILRRPEVTCAITGATQVEQLQQNVMASEIALDDDALAKIEAILGGPEQTDAG
ncbi:MAG: aldo/keto reductase family protein [bacterium]